MNIKELLKTYPALAVVKVKIWTEKRNTIAAQGAFDPLIAMLVSLLLCRREPRTEAERAAMQSLADSLKAK